MGLNVDSTPPKNLWLIRHSEAQNESFGNIDLERALTEKGHQDSVKIGAWLNTLSEQPDWFWVSAAKRTVQTAQLLSQNPNAKLIIEQALYLATAEELLGILRTTPEEQYNIAIVAHNPGISDLVDSLCNTDKYHVLAPSDIAYLRLACEWSEVKPN